MRLVNGLLQLETLFLPSYLASLSFFPHNPTPFVKVQDNICTVIPSGGDDSSAIIAAFQLCSRDATVVFSNATYHIEKVMSTHGLRNVTVDVHGTLLWGTDTDYWIKNSLPLGYQNQTLAWDFGGDDVSWYGHGYGTFDMNGQIWYDLANGTSNMYGRPINLVIRNSTNFYMSGMRFVQSAFWTLTTHTCQHVMFEDIYINSTSTSGAPTQNTDGIDTFYTNNATFRRWSVTNGDDSISPKANSSNLLIQDSQFYGSDSIAIGSIAQYPGVFEFVENVTAERIYCERCKYPAYIKTWTGVQQGYPPNGGGGGLGYARNMVFRDFVVSDLTVAGAYITQCNSYIGATAQCDSSTFTISNITWSNITGTVANSTLAYIQCSGSAPCEDIRLLDFDIKTTGGPFVNCSNVELLGVSCNEPAP
ncbi:pectin lyase-like protein [Vararia minispora EC-137]|uniref:Pectin lyase-like protein n=1 Tax=Vararia minispora EC-137 TaxID=1314806 RepID=A0ACB8Q9P2_9AGAM|nr:pectin lyase-like protein [Vararia minispora EC-137]